MPIHSAARRSALLCAQYAMTAGKLGFLTKGVLVLNLPGLRNMLDASMLHSSPADCIQRSAAQASMLLFPPVIASEIRHQIFSV